MAVTLDRQPTLRGELLELRPLGVSDFEPLYAIAADPLVWEQHPSKDRTQEPVFRAWFDDALASGGALAVIDLEDGRVIGTSRFHGYSADLSEIEIGWTFLARSHWGRGYNTEMKRLMLRHAFRSVKTVIFEIHSENRRSQRAVEKLGAVRCGTKVDAYGRGDNYIFRLRANGREGT
jgi:RimJ/RimL family protein N-acetyltransferase